jgi:hypothetical protein
MGHPHTKKREKKKKKKNKKNKKKRRGVGTNGDATSKRHPPLNIDK